MSAPVAAAAAPSAASAVQDPVVSSSSSSMPREPHSRVERRVITADFDDEGVWCYQAYKPSIGLEAVKRQRFADIPGFSPTRMTWIKFSLGWMMYRCDYARSKDQETVLRIKISWDAFWAILRAAVGSTYDESIYATQKDWQSAMDASEVRYQWDPERDARIEKLGNNQRALQLGLKKSIGTSYATDPKWILKIVNYTPMAQQLRTAIDASEPLPEVPVERTIEVTDAKLRKTLGMEDNPAWVPKSTSVREARGDASSNGVISSTAD